MIGIHQKFDEHKIKKNIQSLAGLILVRIIANTITEMIIIESIRISNGPDFVNNDKIPIIHIIIKIAGNKYLIMNFHIFPTLNVEYYNESFLKPMFEALGLM